MGFSGFGKYGAAFDDGKVHYQYVTKINSIAPGTAGFFVDLNQSTGHPKYNAFVGSRFTFTPLVGNGNDGIYPGPFINGSTKHLISWQIVNFNVLAGQNPPDNILLCDYLGFYPLIDGDDLDLQVLDNTASLPRYTDGENVRIVLIVQAPLANSASLTITYTNSKGVSGRSTTANVIPGGFIGVCATGTGASGGAGQATPFWPLANGDLGVRSIQSIKFATGAGGFICAALVRMIDSISTLEGAVPVERVYGFEKQMPPEIKEGAYLNYLVQRSGFGFANLRSEMIFINS